ncbi:hypothetical protein G6F68_019097 [Rhizopus microsporus]|nr:hypothetical protein G6F68_019097 [Rhizopus microsporus]
MAYGWPLPYSNGGSTRIATAPGLTFSCWMPAIQVARTRSISPCSKRGSRSRSRYSASDGARFSFSADRSTLIESRPAEASRLAPSASAASAKASEPSLPAPSVIRLMVKLAVPGLRPWSALKPPGNW